MSGRKGSTGPSSGDLEAREESTSGANHEVRGLTEFVTGVLSVDNDSSSRLQMPLENVHMVGDTQPVGQFKDLEKPDLPEGPIEPPPQNLSDVREEPYNLPNNYEWSTCDVTDDTTMREVYTLLNNSDVENDDNVFFSDYSVEFLRWALTPPGYYPDWHVGVRAKTSNKLVGFSTAIPVRIRARGTVLLLAEINILCVDKKLISKGLAPVLVNEVKRRVQLEDIWQALYTGTGCEEHPTQISTCQYWIRCLNPKKLIDVGFTSLAPSMTMSRMIELFQLPKQPSTPGFRPMERRDVPAVTRLLHQHLFQFAFAPLLLEDDVEYLLLPIENVMSSFVVENPTSHEITDFCSFYTLPYTVGDERNSLLKVAYSYYNVATSTPLVSLMNDAIVTAKIHDYDMFNALDIMHNESCLKKLKFQPMPGHLRYHLDNYRLRGQLKPSELGLVLLRPAVRNPALEN